MDVLLAAYILVLFVLMIVASTTKKRVGELSPIFYPECFHHDIFDKFGVQIISDPLQNRRLNVLCVQVNDQASKSAPCSGSGPNKGDRVRCNCFGHVLASSDYPPNRAQHGVGSKVSELCVGKSVREKLELYKVVEDWLGFSCVAKFCFGSMPRAHSHLLFIDPVDVSLECADIHFRDFDDAARGLLPPDVTGGFEEL